MVDECNGYGGGYQYYPPRGKHTLCVPIPDGYFDENAKEIFKVEQSRAMTNWKRGRAKLKTLKAFRKRRTSSLMSSSVELNLVDEAHVDSASGRRYSVNESTGGSMEGELTGAVAAAGSNSCDDLVEGVE